MAERELAIILRAKDLASKGVRAVKGEIGSLGKAGSQALNGLTTAIKRVGTAAAVGLVGAIGLGARSLGHLERVTNQTNAVLASTQGISGQTTDSIRRHAEALEQLTTADDKAIQEGQNLLLTFTKIGGKTFPMATEAVTNMAIAMAKGDVANADFKGTALQVGKALNDPIKGITALSRAGVSFTAEQKELIKTLVKAGKVEEAQAVILQELATEFGNAGKAAGTGFEADMRRVQDAGEDASQAIARGVMPALSRFATFLQRKLADPAVLAAIDSLGQELGDAAGAALDFLEGLDWQAIGSGLSTAAGAAKGIVSAFMAMPDWVKTAVITGWGLNKLSGGALTGIIGEVGKGLIKGVLGMNAGVVNINAGVVNGATGLPGVPPAGGGGLLGTLKSAILPVTIVSIAAGVAFQLAGIGDPKHQNPKTGQITRTSFDKEDQIANSMAAIARLEERALGGDQFAASQLVEQRALLAQLRAEQAKTNALLPLGLERLRAAAVRTKDDTVAATNRGATAVIQNAVHNSAAQYAAITRTASAARAAGQQAAAAIKDKDLSVTVPVSLTNYVTIRETVKTRTTFAKYGKIAS